MVKILQVFFYPLLSGLALSAAIPNEIFKLGIPALAFVALVPLFISISGCGSYRQAFAAGFIQTMTTHLCSSFWLGFFKDFALFTLGASALGTACIGGAAGLLLYVPYTGKASGNSCGEFSAENTYYIPLRILWAASSYTLYEWVKSCGFLGYPWGTVSAAMFRWPVIMQIADITGTYGITFLAALSASLCAETSRSCTNALYAPEKARRGIMRQLTCSALVFSALILSSVLYGTFQYLRTRIPQKTLTAVLVQQNSDPWKNSSDTQTILDSQRETEMRLESLAADGKKAELIVWSEGSLKYYFPDSLDYYAANPAGSPLIPFIKKNGIPLLTGGSAVKDRETGKFNNAALMFDGQGNLRGYYGKNHLVPFAEAIPGMENDTIRRIIGGAVGISAGWTPGDRYTFFDIPCSWYPERILPVAEYIDISEPFSVQKEKEAAAPSVRIAAPICFDDAFPDIMRPLFMNGAEVFVNLTDDSWSLKESSEYQHFAVAAYRAIEYRTTLVRSTNAGYSAVVSPSGKIIADMPLFKSCSIAAEIPVYGRTVTIYARFGNWLPEILAMLAAVRCIRTRLEFRSNDYIPSERKEGKRRRQGKNGRKHGKRPS